MSSISYWGIDHGDEIAKGVVSDLKTHHQVAAPYGKAAKGQRLKRAKKALKVNLASQVGSLGGGVAGGTIGAGVGLATRKPHLAVAGGGVGGLGGSLTGGIVGDSKMVRRQYPGYRRPGTGIGLRKIS